MRYIATILLLVLFTIPSASGNNNEYTASEFLAEKWVIQIQTILSDYNIEQTITRREMLKVMMNMSWDEVVDTCTGKFTDMISSDWWCKYAEAALGKWYIAANTTFRPDDNVSKIEAMKFIMQAKSIERDEADDWRVGYITKAVSEWLLDSSFSDYNTSSQRGWIFVTGSKTYTDVPEFLNTPPESDWLTPEEEELLQHFLDI